MESSFTSNVKKLLSAGLIALGLGQLDVSAQSSMNMNLLGQWHDPLIPTQAGYRYSDIWGWASGGHEYAIIGGADKNYIIEVTNPSAPTLRATLASGCTLTKWRDHWTYQNYLYVVSDNCTGGGLQVWNLAPLPLGGNPTLVYNSTALFQTAHTITGDPGSGHIYIAGTDTQNSGVYVLDASGNPTNPLLLGGFNIGAYTHDMYVHHDTLYAFFGNSGVANFDFSDISYPYQMGYLWGYTDNGYAHSGYGLKNNKYMVFTDETAGKSVKVANISDPWTLSMVTTFKSALQGPTYVNSIAHNPVCMGNLAFISYYEDGLQVYDLTNPAAPVRVAYYDMRTNTSYNGMVGAWGVYPNLPSGKILVSDTHNGLFILERLNPFPVNMLSFAATALQDKVQLDWSTSMELNNDAFVVERSLDGENFSDIATQAGAGSSDERHDYRFVDAQPYNGISYYRLRQVDANGGFTHSNVVSVDMKGDAPQMTIYPSPAVRGEVIGVELVCNVPGTASLSVLDMQGRTISNKSVLLSLGANQVEIPTANWAAGNYVVRLESGRFRMEDKILLTN